MRAYLGGTATCPTDRALIRLTGEDVRGFLQGLVTSDVAALDADAPRWTALLTPQCKALFDFLIWADGDAVLLDCEAAEAEALAKRLTLYRLRRPITIEPAGGAVHWAVEGAEGVPDPRLPELGRRWLGAVGAAAADWAEPASAEFGKPTLDRTSTRLNSSH